MRERFFVLIGLRPPALEERITALIESQAGEEARLVLADKTDNRLILIGGDLDIVPVECDRGIVIGALFSRACDKIDGALPSHVAASGGATLTSSYWGRYVAVFHRTGSREITVVRDPSGALGCYSVTSGDLVCIASDPGIAVALGLLMPDIDWSFVAHFLTFPHLRTRRTGLVGLSETLAGTSDCFAPASIRSTRLWSPWTYAAATGRIDDLEIACATVREEAERCGRALAARYRLPLVELSGGLDSAIVAACLGRDHAAFELVNVATGTAEGDERRYARDMAAQLGRPAHEIVLGVDADVDLRRSPAARLARPGGHAVALAWDDAFVAEAAKLGTDVFVSGTGGDNIFCSLASATPAADRLLAHGFGPRALGTISDVAAIHRCTWWRAARMAWRRKRRRQREPLWKEDASFLDPGVVPENPDDHPWLDIPADVPPGKRSHVQSLMVIHSHIEGYARQRHAPVLYPLLAQPLVETCLRIPTWLWVDGGRDRSVARQAFAADLPPSIAHRRTKGRMNSYCATVFDRNRPLLRTMLLDGALAQHAIVDRAAIAAYLDASGPPRDDAFFRVLAIADVEAWAQSWLSRDATPASP